MKLFDFGALIVISLLFFGFILADQEIEGRCGVYHVEFVEPELIITSTVDREPPLEVWSEAVPSGAAVILDDITTESIAVIPVDCSGGCGG